MARYQSTEIEKAGRLNAEIKARKADNYVVGPITDLMRAKGTGVLSAVWPLPVPPSESTSPAPVDSDELTGGDWSFPESTFALSPRVSCFYI